MKSDKPRQSILVVEDEAIVRLMAVDMFENAGFEVLEAATGEKALDLIRTCDLAALFTDVDLANSIDGFHLARVAHNTQPDTPIIVVSGHRAAEDGDLPEGARFIRKPYDPEAVTAALTEMIGVAAIKAGC